MHAALNKVGITDVERATKNLVLKHKKTGVVYLVVVRSTLEGDFAKILTKVLSAGSGNLRNCDQETILELLGAKPGSINPLAVINDKEIKVNLIVDQGLAQAGAKVMMHPMENNKTVTMTWEALEKFCTENGHAPRVVDLEAAPAAAPAAKSGKPAKGGKESEGKKETKLGLQHKKGDDFPKWYQEVRHRIKNATLERHNQPHNIWQVITKAEMIEFYDISGCYILRPWSFYMWECIQHW